MLTLKKVNKALAEQERLKKIVLEKGKGYFYVSSEDKETATKLAALDTTSIYVCCINHQCLDAWISDVKQIVKKINYEII